MSIDAPLGKTDDCSPTARDPSPATAGGRTLRAHNLPNSVFDCQPDSEPVRVLERWSRRLAGVQCQYVVAELFPSLADMEDEDDGVEFCWREQDGE